MSIFIHLETYLKNGNNLSFINIEISHGSIAFFIPRAEMTEAPIAQALDALQKLAEELKEKKIKFKSYECNTEKGKRIDGISFPLHSGL